MVYTTQQTSPDMKPGALFGLKAIGSYLGKSDKTVRKLIRTEGLPARKIGGEWASDKAWINEWFSRYKSDVERNT